MKKEWLEKEITISEAEAENMVSDPRLGPSPVPFGFDNKEWRALLAKMQAADELWTFSSSDESWEHLCGRAGISLVRNGEIIDSVVTLVN